MCGLSEKKLYTPQCGRAAGDAIILLLKTNSEDLVHKRRNLSDTEVVRHGSCPTNSVSCLGKSPTGSCPRRKVIDRKLSETDCPVSCGLPILTNSRGTKAILVSFHDAQSGCGAHMSSISYRPRSKITPNHYNWTFQKNTGVLRPPPLQSVQG